MVGRIPLTVAALLVGASVAHATSVVGKVVGVNGAIQPYVRVELHGPDARTTFTGANGVFTIDLGAGDYVVQVIQDNHAAQFKVTVPASGTVSQTFTLNW